MCGVIVFPPFKETVHFVLSVLQRDKARFSFLLSRETRLKTSPQEFIIYMLEIFYNLKQLSLQKVEKYFTLIIKNFICSENAYKSLSFLQLISIRS